MALTPQDFAGKWKRVTAREKQTYQEHFIDLCHLTHKRLNVSVFAIYGWPSDLSDEEMLERLLALNSQKSTGAKIPLNSPDISHPFGTTVVGRQGQPL